MFEGGRGTASLAKPPRCIVTTKHPLAPLMSHVHASTISISMWSVSFPHHEGTVSSLLLWMASLDGVKPSSWSTVTQRPSSSPSFRTGLLDLAHQKLSQPIAVPSLYQLFSPNYANFWFIRSTTYNPASNGMVERLHRQLKAALMSHAAHKHLTQIYLIPSPTYLMVFLM